MTKTLQLAKPYTKDKLGERVFVSEKYDGVPVRFDVSIRDGLATVSQGRTRQDETAYSCAFIQRDLRAIVQRAITAAPQSDRDWVLIGEVMHETLTGFKDISGVVRRHEPQTGLELHIFDFWDSARPHDNFASRNFALNCLLGSRQQASVRIIRQETAFKHQLDEIIEERMPNVAEGLVIRDAGETFQPGKRTWGYQKVVKEPTIDLHICKFEEGVGKNAGAVGRLIAIYKGEYIGIGPGKLTYAERKDLWRRFLDQPLAFHSSQEQFMACIKYKPDDGYKALRQPTFQYWRKDKKEPDA